MKKFFKKRWHSVPIGLLAGLLSVCLVAGSVFAYTVWSGNAEVTVDECFTVSNVEGDNGDYTGQAGNYEWAVSIYPNETKTLRVNITNASSVGVNASVTYNANAASGLAVSVADGGSSIIPPKGSGMFTLTVSANADVTPGTYTIPIAIGR